MFSKCVIIFQLEKEGGVKTHPDAVVRTIFDIWFYCTNVSKIHTYSNEEQML